MKLECTSNDKAGHKVCTTLYVQSYLTVSDYGIEKFLLPPRTVGCICHKDVHKPSLQPILTKVCMYVFILTYRWGQGPSLHLIIIVNHHHTPLCLLVAFALDVLPTK